MLHGEFETLRVEARGEGVTFITLNHAPGTGGSVIPACE